MGIKAKDIRLGTSSVTCYLGNTLVWQPALLAPTISLNGTVINITNTDARTEYDTVYDNSTLIGTVYLNTQEGSVVTVVSGQVTQSGSEVTIQ